MSQSIFIAGPTAVGKTALSIQLAERVQGEIISVDSMQVYRGLDIGTAKPSPSERGTIPHHLIDVANLNESFDAQQFTQLAQLAEREIVERGKQAIFCGGTGLYFKACREGLDTLPPNDPALRERLENTPLDDLLEELEQSDPAWFQQIDHKNSRRVIRAIEIMRLSGKTVTEQRTTWSSEDSSNRPPLIILTRSREALRQRIETRVDQMFTDGLVEETEALRSKGLSENQSARLSLGYRQVLEYLDNIRSLKDTIALVKTKTWQFSKRQLTWFRKQAKTHWIDLDETPLTIQCDTLLKAGKAP